MSDLTNQPFINLPEYNPGTMPSNESWNGEYASSSKPDYDKRNPSQAISRLAKIAAGIALGGSILTLVTNAFVSAPSISNVTLQTQSDHLHYAFDATFEKEGDLAVNLKSGGQSYSQTVHLTASEDNRTTADYHLLAVNGDFALPSSTYNFSITFKNTYFTRTLYSKSIQ